MKLWLTRDDNGACDIGFSEAEPIPRGGVFWVGIDDVSLAFPIGFSDYIADCIRPGECVEVKIVRVEDQQ